MIQVTFTGNAGLVIGVLIYKLYRLIDSVTELIQYKTWQTKLQLNTTKEKEHHGNQ